MSVRHASHPSSITVVLAALAVASLVGAAPAPGGGNAVTVGGNACSKGHGVSASDCLYYTQGGKVTVCHFEDHAGDYAVASPAACGSDD